MKKTLFFIFSVLYSIVLGQSTVLHTYPEGQVFYKGGYVQFYKEAHDFLIKNDLKPCDNKNEVYMMTILVNADGNINYVKDPDQIGVANNKCTFELAKKILSNLQNFTPAEFNGQKTSALTRILFYPNELFDNSFSLNRGLIEQPEFPGGISNYRKKIISCFDTNGYNYSQSFRFVINFDVDTQGDIQNIYIDTNFNNEQFLKMIVDCVVPRKLKFKPGTFNGVPVTQRFKLPVTINAE